MAVASNVLRRRGCLRPGAALVPVGGRVFHTSDKHSLFILYLEYATARVMPVGGRVFHTEDKRLSLEIGKDAAAVGHDVVDGRVFHKHLLFIRPALRSFHLECKRA